MEFRQAIDAIADRLKRTRIQIIPHPPRDIPTQTAVFFGAIEKARVAQDGGDELRLTLVVAVGSQDDSSFARLEELTDDIDAVIDAADIDDLSWTVLDGDAWVMGMIEVGGIPMFGARLDVAVYY